MSLLRLTYAKKFLLFGFRLPSSEIHVFSRHRTGGTIPTRSLTTIKTTQVPPIVYPPPSPPRKLQLRSFLGPTCASVFLGLSTWIYFNPDPEYQELWHAAESGRPLPGTSVTYEDQNEEYEIEDDEGLGDT
eukprot:CAMPEP_0113311778 /NCGR_PEP_ID=MMETSP0010_2-20120614/8866_1 /TAXON_ID=216773 ORGANISM="Corethron hystrix, Strain 308" /NCGR_SAMPLE_ID=MMETSP0010_2 /ASSEMBLY_ACC=CAM_ASM_000155 /LENGTH=130 /DNA_ID=CAMNT_0000167459 /DNA_START=115 /DNA_END=507 /DNA_ORIENTATION=- /assembly_acc=CAM_ASM_000155